MKKLLKSVTCGTCEQYTGALFTIDLSTIAGWTKKKKKKKLKSWTHNTDAQFKPHLNGVILFKEFNSTHKKNIPPVLLKQNGIGMAIMEWKKRTT